VLHNLIYRAAVDGSFELVSSVTVGFGHPIKEVSPVAHLVKERHARKKHMTTKPGEPEISIGVMFKFRYEVIVNFDMGGITGATESRSGATLVVIQVGNHYKWIRVPQQGASGLR